MPNINIYEYDKTKNATSAYENFAVVVPGFTKVALKDTLPVAEADCPCLVWEKNVGAGDSCWYYYTWSTDANSAIKGAKVFDENGIYECNSQYDFKKYIGYTFESATTAKAAVACEPTLLGPSGSETSYTIPAGTVVYTKVVQSGTGVVGYHKFKITEEETTYYELKYEFISDGHGTFTDTDKYYSCSADKEGNDAVEATVAHYGNQMACELIGLGYTVLFKLLSKDIPLIDSSKKGLEVLYDSNYWAALKDRSAYDFRYITTGLLTDKNIAPTTPVPYAAAIEIAKVAKFINNFDPDAFLEPTEAVNGRGDIIALIDIDESAYTGKNQYDAIKKIVQEAIYETDNGVDKFCEITGPYVEYALNRKEEYDAEGAYNKNRKFPAAFHYLLCAIHSRNVGKYAEWYANAGEVRGFGDFKVVNTGCKFGEIAVNTLAPRYQTKVKVGTEDITIKKATNIIACMRGTYYLYGNRTAEPLGVKGTEDGELKASHFLNIRELCCTLKKIIYVACKRFTFDPNNNILWTNFCNAIRPTLEKMKANEGIRDYQFVKSDSTKKATLDAKVRIVPIEAVEDFNIGVFLENSISGTDVSVEEE